MHISIDYIITIIGLIIIPLIMTLINIQVKINRNYEAYSNLMKQFQEFKISETKLIAKIQNLSVKLEVLIALNKTNNKRGVYK